MKTKQIRIVFLLPCICFNPVGGYKIVFEYANRLAADNYDVTIAYANFILKEFLSASLRGKCSILRRNVFGPKNCSARRWFNLHSTIKEIYPHTLKYKKELEGDIYVATACETANYLSNYPANKKKLYFIQGYENWDMSDEELNKTYSYPFKKITISKWLHQLLEERGYKSTIIPNGFDPKEYYITIPIENKKKLQISVLYHDSPVKDFTTALNALKLVHKQYGIHVVAFGTSFPIEPLPSWIEFHFSPPHEEHLRINNESSIYIAASKSDGWGLTIGEAMMCGQAVVCTEAEGFMEMAIPERNALVSPCQDAEGLARNIIRLLENDDLRYKIARQGAEDIKRFKIDESYKKFRKEIEQ